MNPLKLTLRKARTFDDFELEFTDGVLAILGSNGAGKSTLVNAMEIALFGSRSLGDWYPREGSGDPLQIELVFEHGSDIYRVRRSYSPKGRGQAKTDFDKLLPKDPRHVPSEDEPEYEGNVWFALTRESIAETNDEIERIIGLSRGAFRASSFLAEGATGFFCEAPARDRKRYLGEMVGLADWDAHLERARREKRIAEDELAKIAGQVEQAEGELQEHSLIEQERADAVHTARGLEFRLSQATAALATAREALAEQERQAETRRNAEIALQRAEGELAELRAGIAGREQQVGKIDEALAKRDDLVSLMAELPRLREEQETYRVGQQQAQERQRLDAEGTRLLEQRESFVVQALEMERRAISALEHIGSDTCDRCGQTLHEDAAKRAAESYRDDAKKLQAKADEADEAVEKTATALLNLPANDDFAALTERDHEYAANLPKMIQEREDAQQQLAQMDELVARRATAQGALDEMRAGLSARENSVASARAAVDDAGPHDPRKQEDLERAAEAASDTLDALDGERLEAERTIARSQERLERLDRIAANIDNAKQARNAFQDDLAVLTNLERACGPNGVPALILENVAIPQIETEASRILALLGGPAYAVELRTLREKKTGGISDTLDIVCLTATGEAPYENFSTGERARIALALRLASAQLLANRKGSPTGLLVIDDIGGIDADGISALVEVLGDLARHIPKIIIVSQVAELRDAFENCLLLENVDGVSRVVSDARFVEEATA